MDKSVSLRPAAPYDAKLIFGWRNDPFILERSSSRKTVSWEEHKEWITRVLSDANVLMFIIQWSEEPVGLLRYEFDPDSRSCIVSVYVLEKYTGHGIGTQALALGMELVWIKWPADKIVAHVRCDNTAGQKGFHRAGFIIENNPVDCPAHHTEFVYERR